MELKWLDDYIALIETGSFSAAAERRHVSQPAFSRRIQLLEDWLGVTLIDRARKPLRFTPVATENQAAFRSLVARIYEFRATLKSESLDIADLTIAAQHSQAEILIAYETAQTSCGIPSPIAMRQVLGVDKLVLVASPALHASLSVLRNDAPPVPMLCFPPESFFGQVVRLEALAELLRRQQVVVRCVSEFALGLRELALVGQGVAWLPTSLIAEDLKRGRLLPLESLGRSVSMDIVAFFAVRTGDKGELLQRQFQALRDPAALLPQAAARTRKAAAAESRRVTKPPRARWRRGYILRLS